MRRPTALLFTLTLLTLAGALPASAAPQLEAGGDHTLVLDADGVLWVWGFNFFGQLGLGDFVDRTGPVPVGLVGWVAGGDSHSAAIQADGGLWTWGRGQSGEIGNGQLNFRLETPVSVDAGPWSSVFAHHYHNVALRSDGSLWTWGNNVQGEAGLGAGAPETILAPTRVGTRTDWETAAAGEFHTLALRSDGSLWAWGENSSGQLGLGDVALRTAPVRVGTATDWSAIATGGGHSLARKSDGSLWAWGHNLSGQLGLGDDSDRQLPTRVGTGNDWAAIAAGDVHTVALKSDGSLWTWGENVDGQLGLGFSGFNTEQELPMRVGSDNDWLLIEAGEFHTVAAKADGSVYTWGANGFGQLGDGTTAPRDVPGAVFAIALPEPQMLLLQLVGFGTAAWLGLRHRKRS